MPTEPVIPPPQTPAEGLYEITESSIPITDQTTSDMPPTIPPPDDE
jgi:hypothetical protein